MNRRGRKAGEKLERADEGEEKEGDVEENWRSREAAFEKRERERERDVLWFKESQERSEGRGQGDEGVAIMSQICKSQQHSGPQTSVVRQRRSGPLPRGAGDNINEFHRRLKKMKAEAQDESVDTTAPDGVMESLSIGAVCRFPFLKKNHESLDWERFLYTFQSRIKFERDDADDANVPFSDWFLSVRQSTSCEHHVTSVKGRRAESRCALTSSHLDDRSFPSKEILLTGFIRLDRYQISPDRRVKIVIISPAYCKWCVDESHSNNGEQSPSRLRASGASELTGNVGGGGDDDDDDDAAWIPKCFIHSDEALY
ncbi:hypothetical protein F2P81_018180 [Scophthalmus maximus]|uniref:Uncharacterized protein n=1 Tax=Scophthalmus maximus TaxID=52904 RepID=A0A6A4S9P7_SCOMX|nr:hypothetical protein F2P81_018180 [Scophthalmus maximus]